MVHELRKTWDSLRHDSLECGAFIEEDLTGSILGAEAVDAGDRSIDGSSRTKIIQLFERLHLQALNKGLEQHHNQEARPVKRFGQRDKVSQAWLSALCTSMSYIPSPEFTQAMAWHFFVPSPACSPHIGQMVDGKPLDKYGEVLLCAKLPFDTWRKRHDRVKVTIEVIINDCGVIADMEPYGLFSALIPSTATSSNGDLQYSRDRQGLVPDFLITLPAQHGPSSCQLAELKCISAGATWYKSN